MCVRGHVYVCACVCVSMSACMCMCPRVCERVCVCVCVCFTDEWQVMAAHTRVLSFGTICQTTNDLVTLTPVLEKLTHNITAVNSL